MHINLETNWAYTRKLSIQLGATIQSAKYKTEELIWEANIPTDNTPPTSTRNMLRAPQIYGFWTAVYNPFKTLNLSYSGVNTGKMDVAHVVNPETEYTIVQQTPDFWEHNLKVDYTFYLDESYSIQTFLGVQNIWNSYQTDFDTGANRDAGYIYGPTRPRTLFAGISLGLNGK